MQATVLGILTLDLAQPGLKLYDLTQEYFTPLPDSDFPSVNESETGLPVFKRAFQLGPCGAAWP